MVNSFQKSDAGESDWKLEMTELFKAGPNFLKQENLFVVLHVVP